MSTNNPNETRFGERKRLLDHLRWMVQDGTISLGDAIRILRSSVLELDRVSFASICQISPRTLANLEDNPKANPRLETIRRVFAPFGLQVGLLYADIRSDMPDIDQEVRQRLLDAMEKNRRKPPSS